MLQNGFHSWINQATIHPELSGWVTQETILTQTNPQTSLIFLKQKVDQYHHCVDHSGKFHGNISDQSFPVWNILYNGAVTEKRLQLLTDLRWTTETLADLNVTTETLTDLRWTTETLAALKVTTETLTDLRWTTETLADLNVTTETLLNLPQMDY